MTKNERKYSAYLCTGCDISTVSAKGETCKECRATAVRLAKLTELDNVSAAESELDFELRAAFGPGEKIVNIVTGKRYRT